MLQTNIFSLNHYIILISRASYLLDSVIYNTRDLLHNKVIHTLLG